MNWVSAESCEAVASFGWFVGAATGTFADIVILILIATAPKLGTSRIRTSPLPTWQRLLPLLLQHSLWLLAIPWILGGLYAGRAFISCYLTMLAITSALTIGIVLLLAMMTAANQIGARSVR